MIITIDYLLDAGFDISEEINTNKLYNAIRTAEWYIVKPRLGDMYIPIEANDGGEYDDILEGGIVTNEEGKEIHLAGLQLAEANIAYGLLLRDNVNATIFGDVKKSDDYSDQATEADIKRVAMFHNEQGLAYLKEVTDFLKIKQPEINNGYWNEYL